MAAAALLYPALSVSDERIAGPIAEHKIKAAFIFNFVKFIEWPQHQTASNFCVAGQPELFSALDEISRNRTIAGRQASVRWVAQDPVPATCEVLVLAFPDQKRSRALVQVVQDRSVLTIGQSERFLESGGIVNFVVTRDEIHFEFNLRAAQRAGLTISSRLLQLAERVCEQCFPEK